MGASSHAMPWHVKDVAGAKKMSGGGGMKGRQKGAPQPQHWVPPTLSPTLLITCLRVPPASPPHTPLLCLQDEAFGEGVVHTLSPGS